MEINFLIRNGKYFKIIKSINKFDELCIIFISSHFTSLNDLHSTKKSSQIGSEEILQSFKNDLKNALSACCRWSWAIVHNIHAINILLTHCDPLAHKFIVFLFKKI